MEVIKRRTGKETRFELVNKGETFLYKNHLAIKIAPFEDSFDGDGINAVFLDNGDAIWLDCEDMVYITEACSIAYV